MAYEDLFIFGDDELPTSAGMVRRGPYGPRRPLTPEQQAERDAKRAHRDLVEKVRMDTEAEIAEQESAQPTVETDQQRTDREKKERTERAVKRALGPDATFGGKFTRGFGFADAALPIASDLYKVATGQGGPYGTIPMTIYDIATGGSPYWSPDSETVDPEIVYREAMGRLNNPPGMAELDAARAASTRAANVSNLPGAYPSMDAPYNLGQDSVIFGTDLPTSILDSVRRDEEAGLFGPNERSLASAARGGTSKLRTNNWRDDSDYAIDAAATASLPLALGFAGQGGFPERVDWEDEYDRQLLAGADTRRGYEKLADWVGGVFGSASTVNPGGGITSVESPVGSVGDVFSNALYGLAGNLGLSTGQDQVGVLTQGGGGGFDAVRNVPETTENLRSLYDAAIEYRYGEDSPYAETGVIPSGMYGSTKPIIGKQYIDEQVLASGLPSGKITGDVDWENQEIDVAATDLFEYDPININHRIVENLMPGWMPEAVGKFGDKFIQAVHDPFMQVRQGSVPFTEQEKMGILAAGKPAVDYRDMISMVTTPEQEQAMAMGSAAEKVAASGLTGQYLDAARKAAEADPWGNVAKFIEREEVRQQDDILENERIKAENERLNARIAEDVARISRQARSQAQAEQAVVAEARPDPGLVSAQAAANILKQQRTRKPGSAKKKKAKIKKVIDDQLAARAAQDIARAQEMFRSDRRNIGSVEEALASLIGAGSGIGAGAGNRGGVGRLGSGPLGHAADVGRASMGRAF